MIEQQDSRRPTCLFLCYCWVTRLRSERYWRDGSQSEIKVCSSVKSCLIWKTIHLCFLYSWSYMKHKKDMYFVWHFNWTWDLTILVWPEITPLIKKNPEKISKRTDYWDKMIFLFPGMSVSNGQLSPHRVILESSRRVP